MIEHFPVEASPGLFPHLVGERLDGLPFKWQSHRHLRYVSMRIANAVAKGNGRLIFNWPPGFGKTVTAANVVPAWFFHWWPDKRIILVMHSASLAQDEGRKARDLISANPWLGVKLLDAQEARAVGAQGSAKSRGKWYTSHGGAMASIGVGQGTYGVRGDLIITDDLYPNWKSAQSVNYRKEVNEWWHGTLWNRRRDGATVVLNMQRLHDEDIAGTLIRDPNGEPWEVIRLPALADSPDDPIGRSIGEPLCPAMFGEEFMASAQRSPSMVWNAVYQQKPDKAGVGAVYRNFTDENIDDTVSINPMLPLQISIDFNVNPGMHILCGQHDPMRNVAWDCHEIYSERLHLDGAMDALVKWMSGMNGSRPKMVEVFGDASGQAATIGDGTAFYDRVRTKLDEAKIPYRLYVPTSNPPIQERIMLVNDMLCGSDMVRRYFCRKECVQLINDFRYQRLDVDGHPSKADRMLGHSADGLGYRLHHLQFAATLRLLRPGRPVFGR